MRIFYFNTTTYSEACTGLVRTAVWNCDTCVRTLREKTWNHLLHVFTHLLLWKVKKKNDTILGFVNATLHTYHRRDRPSICLSISQQHRSGSVSITWEKESVDRKTFWCLLFLLALSLHFRRRCTSLSHDRSLRGSCQAFLLRSWCHSLKEREGEDKKKTRKEKINTSLPFLRNQTLDWCWENRGGGERGAITWIHSSYDLPEDGDPTPPDTRWHFTAESYDVSRDFPATRRRMLTTDVTPALTALWLETWRWSSLSCRGIWECGGRSGATSSVSNLSVCPGDSWQPFCVKISPQIKFAMKRRLTLAPSRDHQRRNFSDACRR